jgi:hypothetical protein
MMARASTAPTIAVAMVHFKVLVAAISAFASRYGRRPATGGSAFTGLTLISFKWQINALTWPRQNPCKVKVAVPLAALRLHSNRNGSTLSGL